jgi:NADP-dependent aldehyde dehydrogenase
MTEHADVDDAVAQAMTVMPALAAAGCAGRARLMLAIADELHADGDAIVELADRETALGLPRLRGELARTVHQLRLFADVLSEGGYLEVTIDHADPDAAPAPRPDLRRMLVPVGPVAVYAASNFPLAFSVAGGDTTSALAAGCPVVVKVHSGHPHTSLRCGAAVRQGATVAGLPEDVLQLVQGRSAGVALVRHDDIQAVGFTGSVEGGRALYDIAVSRPRPIPFYGELGSINPFVVTPAAAAERAEEIGRGLAGSFTLGLGQFCTKPGLAFVPDGEDGERLIQALVGAAAPVPGGRMLTPAIRDSFHAGADERAAQPGVRTVLAAKGESKPRVLLTRAPTMPDMLLDECFGPLVVVVEYNGSAQLSAALNRVPGSLTATIHCGQKDEIVATVVRQLIDKVGRMVFNGYPTGVAVTWAMHHGGPYPSSTFPHHTSVGATAIRRFLRPVAYQDAPEAQLPLELREDNPLRLPRRVNGRYVPGA